MPGTSRPSTPRCSSSRFTDTPTAPGRDSLRDELRHAGDVVVGRGFVGGAALAHHERAHRAVRDLGGDVDGAWDAVERVEVFGDGLPVPLDGLAQGRAGMPSTPSMRPISQSWRSAAAGANPTPQLPITTVVMPCQIDGVSSGSQVTWPS